MTQDDDVQQTGAQDDTVDTGGAAPAEIEAAMAALRVELEEARTALDGRQHQVAALQAELATSLTRYREALLSSVPDVPAELVAGDTVAALDQAFTRAKGLVEQVQRQVEARMARERVPAGAPPRSAPDLSNVSAQGEDPHRAAAAVPVGAAVPAKSQGVVHWAAQHPEPPERPCQHNRET